MIHTNHISTTPASTSDFSSAIDRGTVPRAESDEKSEVLAGVVEIMLTVNYSHSGEVLRLLGTSPRDTITKQSLNAALSTVKDSESSRSGDLRVLCYRVRGIRYR